jgi:hypothetical protein
MARSRRPAVVRVRKVLSGDFSATQWVNADLPELNRYGRILSVKARLDSTDDAATSATAYIVDGSETGNALATGGAVLPEDGVVFYQSSSVTFTGSDKTADLAESLSDPGDFYVKNSDTSLGTSDLRLGLLVVGTGAFKFYVDIMAEVEG